MLTDGDSATSQPVVLVNESFVRRFFPGEEPIGRRVTFGNPTRPATRWQTIVGVVADTKRAGFEREPWAETYFPLRQAATGRLLVFLRTAGDPVTVAGAAQSAVWALDPNQAVASVRTIDEMLAQADANRRFTTLLLGVFAGVALLLAAIGVYGVLAYATAQRTREIGIRMALGADRGMVLRMVLAGGVKIAGAGLILGIAGAFGVTHVLSGLLFGISPRDPLTFTLVPALLLVVALAACWIPARRAVRVEPVLALRGE
jgi:putative ABC transport system permease protein